MAKNPMQRKAQNSFLLGMLITLLITGIVIAILIVQLHNINTELTTLNENKAKVCALNTPVKSGQIITQDLVQVIEVDKSAIPRNAFGSDVSNINTYSLSDPAGNAIGTDENGQLYVSYYDETTQTNRNRVIIESGDSFYYQDNNEKIEITSVPIVAKVDMEVNTVLTSSLVIKDSDLVTDDTRKVEYNMILPQTQLESGTYVDIRLRLPDGADYIVVSHKQIEIPAISGIESQDTMSFNMNEIEILTLSCAIVESYKIQGSLLYVTEYVEPGLQNEAAVTYVPDNTTLALIQRNPNCVEEAKQALWNRVLNADRDALNSDASNLRNPVNNALNQNAEDAIDNVIDNVEEEIRKTQEERQSYLDSLGGTN